MAKKEKEVVEKAKNEPKGNVTKVKEKMKKPVEVIEQTITKVDLNKPPKPKKDEIKENNPNDEGVVAKSDNAESTEKQKEVQSEEKTQETPVLEEITEEEVKDEATELTEELLDAKVEEAETGKKLPENLQKVVDFMEETGGTLEDYVTLNQDYSELDNDTLLREYYKSTKPHLDNEEINFLMEDAFSYDEEDDTEREIKRKKLALKEQVASAKAYLDGQKSKYYEEIKAGSKLTKEQQKAVNFFNRYNKESEANNKVAEKGKSVFLQKTNDVFSEDFKGFDFKVGDKKYRFNVKNVDQVKSSQSDISNFVSKFTDKENGLMSDAKGYHKSLYAAMNPDALANHFYEQGKADALKDSVAKSKNVSMTPRQSFSGDNTSGPKVRVLGDDSPDFKFKIKNK
jgi:hypothetical protein